MKCLKHKFNPFLVVQLPVPAEVLVRWHSGLIACNVLCLRYRWRPRCCDDALALSFADVSRIVFGRMSLFPSLRRGGTPTSLPSFQTFHSYICSTLFFSCFFVAAVFSSCSMFLIAGFTFFFFARLMCFHVHLSFFWQAFFFVRLLGMTACAGRASHGAYLGRYFVYP